MSEEKIISFKTLVKEKEKENERIRNTLNKAILNKDLFGIVSYKYYNKEEKLNSSLSAIPSAVDGKEVEFVDDSTDDKGVRAVTYRVYSGELKKKVLIKVFNKAMAYGDIDEIVFHKACCDIGKVELSPTIHNYQVDKNTPKEKENSFIICEDTLSLKTFSEVSSNFNKEKSRNNCDNLAKVLLKLQEQGHTCPINPNNIRVRENGSFVVSDLSGMKKCVPLNSDELEKYVPANSTDNLTYLAPEINCDKDHYANSDLWAAGMIVYQILSQNKIFSSSEEYKNKFKNCSADEYKNMLEDYLINGPQSNKIKLFTSKKNKEEEIENFPNKIKLFTSREKEIENFLRESKIINENDSLKIEYNRSSINGILVPKVTINGIEAIAIGGGSYGSVYKIKGKNQAGEDTDYALKIPHFENSFKENESDIGDEIYYKFLQKMKKNDTVSEAMLNMEYFTNIDKRPVSISEFCEKGSIDEILNKNKDTIDKDARKTPVNAKMICDLLEVLKAFEDEKLAYLDMKPGNLGVRNNDSIAIFDFGNMRRLNDINGKSPPTGTVCYTAPEIAGVKGDYSKSDIWSLGVTLVELLTGKNLLRNDQGMINFTLFTKEDLLKNLATEAINGIPNIFDDEIMLKSLKDLLTQMCVIDPENRISATDALKSARKLKEREEMLKKSIQINSADEELGDKKQQKDDKPPL
ncbi:MAG: protein kinase [Rickettsiales bacterium]|jgi:serine/threonine protein kinase|nr:protein kinase [Rickettsiales bacterium]